MEGTLVLAGGGDISGAIAARTLQLAGGSKAVVAVLPQALDTQQAGNPSLKIWLGAGAASACKVDFRQPDAARQLASATLIWISGGNQNRFMAAIKGTGLEEVIRTQFQKGTVVGGTSAGAAVMSEWMLTYQSDPTSVTAGSAVLKKGLALWPDVIVDQHFVTRQRANRLLTAVLERPAFIGVGIDEATAIVVRQDHFEVVGKSGVVVLDARGAKVGPASAGNVTPATDVRLSLLTDGMSYAWKR